MSAIPGQLHVCVCIQACSLFSAGKLPNSSGIPYVCILIVCKSIPDQRNDVAKLNIAASVAYQSPNEQDTFGPIYCSTRIAILILRLKSAYTHTHTPDIGEIVDCGDPPFDRNDFGRVKKDGSSLPLASHFCVLSLTEIRLNSYSWTRKMKK